MSNRKEEWARPAELLLPAVSEGTAAWVPSAWDKPLLYFYTKQSSLRVKVKVTFSEGAPVCGGRRHRAR